MSVLFLNKPRAVQHTGPVQIDPYWLRRGLQMVVDGGVVVFNREVTRFKSNILTGGPKQQTSEVGKAMGFGPTYGLGTADAIAGHTLAPPKTSNRSVVMELYPKTTGGGTLGRVFQDATGTGLARGESAYFNASSGFIYNIYVADAAGAISWNFSTVLTLGVWQVLGISLRHVPSVAMPAYSYINGKFISSTDSLATSGTIPGSNLPTDLVFGNRPSDSARVWDGMQGLLLFFDGFLTAKEHAILAANPRQVILARQAVYAPAAAPSIFSCSISEAFSASASSSSATTFSGAIAESLSVVSTLSAVNSITRPISDVTTTGWEASSGTDLSAMIDESAASDADYITSPDLTSGASTTIFTLSQPLVASTYVARFRSEKATAPARSVRIHLMDSSSTIVGSSSWQALTASYTTYELSVTTSGLATRVGIEAQ